MAAYESLYHRLAANCCQDGDCWTWIGPTRRHAGGDRPAVSMRVPGVQHPRQHNVARLICEMFHGPAPTPEHDASHLCRDNWLCIHPWHLIWETKSQNCLRRLKHHDDMESDPDLDPDIHARGVPVKNPEAIPF